MSKYSKAVREQAMQISGERVSYLGNSKCKDPEAETWLDGMKNSKGTSEAEVDDDIQ